MKHVKVLVCAAALVLSTSSFAAGIPTVDAAAINQMVQQIVEMQKQYAKMQEQYIQLQTITSKLDGISGISDLLRNEEALELFPDIYKNMTEFTKDVMSEGAKKIYELRNYKSKCENLSPELKTICEQENAYKASQEYQFVEAIEKIQSRISNLDSLMNEIKNCQTSKQVQDLQARISAELGMVQAANIKTELLKDAYEASLEGVQAQRQAKITEYFSMPDDIDLSSAFE